jgi:hypothetical protein
MKYAKTCFLTWIYISVVKCIFSWILTCAIFTKICAWSLSERWKTLFCPWKVKFWRKKFSSTLLYEMFPLWKWGRMIKNMAFLSWIPLKRAESQVHLLEGGRRPGGGVVIHHAVMSLLGRRRNVFRVSTVCPQALVFKSKTKEYFKWSFLFKGYRITDKNVLNINLMSTKLLT